MTDILPVRWVTRVLLGSWHRVAVAVKGNSATLFVDCSQRATQALERDSRARIDRRGVTIIGQDLLTSRVFKVGRDAWMKLAPVSKRHEMTPPIYWLN